MNKVTIQLRQFRKLGVGVQLTVLLVILITIPLSVYLVTRFVLFLSGAATASINFSPSNFSLSSGTPNQTVSLNIGSGTTQVGFARVEVNFDTTKLSLSGSINTGVSPLKNVVSISSQSQANSTGKIVIVLAANPGDSLPSGTFTIAQIPFGKVTTVNTSTAISIAGDLQLVDSSASVMGINAGSAAVTLNPTTVTATPTFPPTATPTGAPSGIISALSVKDTTNAASWSIQQNLQVGNVQYGDRSFKFTAVPSLVVGSEWIRTANNSKSYTGNPLVTFNLNTSATVYIAHDDRITSKPSWLSSSNAWSDTGVNLVNDESTPITFSLFAKRFASGTVSLGPNGDTSWGMYTIVVKPDVIASVTPTPTRTPTPSPTSPPSSTANVSVEPLSVSLTNSSPSTNLTVYADVGTKSLVFAWFELSFNPSLVRLNAELDTSASPLTTIIQKTSMLEANSTGKIVVVIAAPPGSSPTGKIQLVRIPITKNTSTTTSTQMSIGFTQLIDANNVEFTVTKSNSTINISGTGATATPTPHGATSTPRPTPPGGLTPGDADEDGDVDGIDYAFWFLFYGKSTQLKHQNGDFNGNGFVDGLDYAIWFLNYTGDRGSATPTPTRPFTPTPTPVSGNTLSFSPSSVSFTQGGSSTLKIVTNVGSNNLVFSWVEFTFDTSRVKLASEVNTSSSPLSTVIQKTTMAEANSTGKVILVLAAPPGANNTGTIELGQITLTSSTLSGTSQIVFGFTQLINSQNTEIQVTKLPATVNVVFP